MTIDLQTLAQHGTPPALVALIFMFKMYLDRKRQGGVDIKGHDAKRIARIEADTRWLKEVHNVKDSDGVFSWYVRASLKEEISRLAEAISDFRITMHDLHKGQEQQTKVLEALVERITK